jgi:hypothetical protein
MNQYRCETCQYNLKAKAEPPYIWCSKSEELLVGRNAQKIISVVGCASHSDFQSERDKVLDDVISHLEKLYFWYDCEPQPSAEFEEGACSALDHALIKISELRQSKREERG